MIEEFFAAMVRPFIFIFYFLFIFLFFFFFIFFIFLLEIDGGVNIENVGKQVVELSND